MHVYTHVLGQWYKLTLNPEAKNATVFRSCFNPPNYIRPFVIHNGIIYKPRYVLQQKCCARTYGLNL